MQNKWLKKLFLINMIQYYIQIYIQIDIFPQFQYPAMLLLYEKCYLIEAITLLRNFILKSLERTKPLSQIFKSNVMSQHFFYISYFAT